MPRTFGYAKAATDNTYRRVLLQAKQEVTAAIVIGNGSSIRPAAERVIEAVTTMTFIDARVNEEAVSSAIQNEFASSFLEVDVRIGTTSSMTVAIGLDGDGGYHPSIFFFNFRTQDKHLFDPKFLARQTGEQSDAAFQWPFQNPDEREYAQHNESHVRACIAKVIMHRVHSTMPSCALSSGPRTDFDDDTLHPRYELANDLLTLATRFLLGCRQ